MKLFNALPKELQEQYKKITTDSEHLESMAKVWHDQNNQLTDTQNKLKEKETAEETRQREAAEAAERQRLEQERAAELKRLQDQNPGSGNDKLLESIQQLIQKEVGGLKDELGGRLTTLEKGYQSQQQQQSSAIEAENKARLEKFGDAAKAFIEGSGKTDPAEIKAMLDSGEKAGLFKAADGGGNSNRSNGNRGADKPTFSHSPTNNGGGNNNSNNTNTQGSGLMSRSELSKRGTEWSNNRYNA